MKNESYTCLNILWLDIVLYYFYYFLHQETTQSNLAAVNSTIQATHSHLVDFICFANDTVNTVMDTMIAREIAEHYYIITAWSKWWDYFQDGKKAVQHAQWTANKLNERIKSQQLFLGTIFLRPKSVTVGEDAIAESAEIAEAAEIAEVAEILEAAEAVEISVAAGMLVVGAEAVAAETAIAAIAPVIAPVLIILR